MPKRGIDTDVIQQLLLGKKFKLDGFEGGESSTDGQVTQWMPSEMSDAATGYGLGDGMNFVSGIDAAAGNAGKMAKQIQPVLHNAGQAGSIVGGIGAPISMAANIMKIADYASSSGSELGDAEPGISESAGGSAGKTMDIPNQKIEDGIIVRIPIQNTVDCFIDSQQLYLISPSVYYGSIIDHTVLSKLNKYWPLVTGYKLKDITMVVSNVVILDRNMNPVNGDVKNSAFVQRAKLYLASVSGRSKLPFQIFSKEKLYDNPTQDEEELIRSPFISSNNANTSDVPQISRPISWGMPALLCKGKWFEDYSVMKLQPDALRPDRGVLVGSQEAWASASNHEIMIPRQPEDDNYGEKYCLIEQLQDMRIRPIAFKNPYTMPFFEPYYPGKTVEKETLYPYSGNGNLVTAVIDGVEGANKEQFINCSAAYSIYVTENTRANEASDTNPIYTPNHNMKPTQYVDGFIQQAANITYFGGDKDLPPFVIKTNMNDRWWGKSIGVPYFNRMADPTTQLEIEEQLLEDPLISGHFFPCAVLQHDTRPAKTRLIRFKNEGSMSEDLNGFVVEGSNVVTTTLPEYPKGGLPPIKPPQMSSGMLDSMQQVIHNDIAKNFGSMYHFIGMENVLGSTGIGNQSEVLLHLAATFKITYSSEIILKLRSEISSDLPGEISIPRRTYACRSFPDDGAADNVRGAIPMKNLFF